MKNATNTFRALTHSCAALLATSVLSAGALAQDAPASIPTSLTGTYDLTYANAQAGSPVSNGETISVVLSQDGTMCLAGYTLSNPVTRNGNLQEAIWVESTL